MSVMTLNMVPARKIEMSRLLLVFVLLAGVDYSLGQEAPNAPETPGSTKEPSAPPAADSPPGAAISDTASTGVATTWQYPLDAAVGPDGTYYIVDRKLPGLWKLAGLENTIIYQGEKKFRTPLNAPRCVHYGADGVIYVGDSATREIYSISSQGEAKPLTHGTIGIPTAIAVAEGTVYATDLELQRIWKFPTSGLPITQQPVEFAVIGGCRGLYVDDKGFIWALSSIKPQLRKYTGDGKFETIVDDLVFEFPHQVCVTTDGTAYVTDGYAKAIWKIAPGGKPEKWVSGEPFVNPIGIRLHGADFIVCDSRANALFKVTSDAKIEKIFGGSPNPLPIAAPAVAPAAGPSPPENPASNPPTADPATGTATPESPPSQPAPN